MSMNSALELEVESIFRTQDHKELLHNWLGLVQGEFKVPQDGGQHNLLLVQGKLLTNAVPVWNHMTHMSDHM